MLNRSSSFVMVVGVSAVVAIASFGCSKKDSGTSPSGSASVNA